MSEFDDDKLLDHEYDGIRELDNNLPNWWLNGFYFSMLFAVGYLFIYHVFEWAPNSRMEYRKEMVTAVAKYRPDEIRRIMTGNFKVQPEEEFKFSVLTDDYNISEGKKLYLTPSQLCFTCHGQNGEGLVGPNLTDKYWLKGCSIDSIVNSIKVGSPAKGMLPYGSGQKISNQKLMQLASYIISLRGTNPANVKAPDLTRAKVCEEDS